MRLTVIVIFITLISGCDLLEPDNGVERQGIAIYAGPGCWDESVTALTAALKYNGYSVDTIGLGYLLHNGLDQYQAVILPGGDVLEMAQTLGPIGREKIKGFVSSGGGYVGCSAGSILAGLDIDELDVGLGLFNGETRWPVREIAPYPNYTLTGIRLVNLTHYIGNGDNGQVSYYSTLYRWGPEFIPHEEYPYEIIYNYELTNSPACIAVTYGFGRVILFGFHPEFEEGSNNDNSLFGDELADNDSEWGILSRAVNFVVSNGIIL